MPQYQKKDPKSPLNLPRRSTQWLAAVRRMHSWIDDQAGKPARANAILILDTHNGYLLGSNITGGRPTPEQVRQELWKAMRRPLRELRQPPHRPQAVIFEEAELAASLESNLAEIGVETRTGEDSSLIDKIVATLESSMGLDEDVAPPLSDTGARPDQLGKLFAAAAEFFRAAPWIYLSDEQPLAYTLEPGGESGFVQLMGGGGVQYGLLLYHDWQDLFNTYLYSGDPLGKVPPTGWVSVSYETEDGMPFNDLDAIETHDWPVAGEAAYPLFVVFFPDHTERPSLVDLKAFYALLKTIPGFVDALLPDGGGDYLPLVTESSIRTLDGEARMTIKYPAGELRKEAFPVKQPEWTEVDDDEDEEIESEGEAPPFLDMRALEGQVSELIAEKSGDEIEVATPLEQAQKLMYQAWNEPDLSHRIQLAHQALKISPDCADAYVLLAEDYAMNIGQALGYYQRGVEAGQRALGETYFQENAGRFWGLLETRPYMRARAGLAECLVGTGKIDEAIDHYKEMLRLNPNDNQGLRYILLNLLIDLGHDQEAHELVDVYSEDIDCHWKYNRALLIFRRDGTTPDATAALLEALDRNPHVPEYLTGRKRLPINMPDAIVFGEDSEAQDYANSALNNWRRTAGAIDWLKGHPLPKSKPKNRPLHKPGNKKSKSKRR